MNARLIGLLLGVFAVASLFAKPALPTVPVNTVAIATQAPNGAVVVSTPPTIGENIPVRREEATTDSPASKLWYSLWVVTAIGILAWVSVRLRHRKSGKFPSNPTGTQSLASSLASLFGAPVSSDIRVKGSTRLTPRHSLHTVEWQGTNMLVACSEQGIQVLAQREAPTP